MTTGLYREDFSLIFSKLIERAGISCYQISQYSHLDQAYLSRLRSGEKNNPSPETVMEIGLALAHLGGNISLYDVEGLFNSVGRSILIQR